MMMHTSEDFSISQSILYLAQRLRDSLGCKQLRGHKFTYLLNYLLDDDDDDDDGEDDDELGYSILNLICIIYSF